MHSVGSLCVYRVTHLYCLLRLPLHRRAARRRRSVAIIAAGLGCEDMLTRHVAALVFLPCVSVSPCGSVLILRGGTPGGCCAWAAAPGVCHRRSCVGELPRHTPQTHFSVSFLVLARDGSSLLFFDCGFCSVLLAVYTKQTRGRPSWQQLWERALQDHIMNHHELPHGIRLQRPVWWRPGEAIDRPLTHEELAHTKTPRAATAAPATRAAALVEDEPSGSGSKRRKVQVDPIARDWFLDMLGQWRRERRSDMQRCLCEVQRLCPGMFDGINPNTPYRWKRSTTRAEKRGRRTLLSPADMTRLSEHIMKVTDVLCLSAVTIRGLVLEPKMGPATSAWHVLELQEARQVLEGAPQPCSARGQHAPALHQAVLAHGQARCQRRPRREHRRDLLPSPPGASHWMGPPRREASSAAGATRGRRRHSQSPSAWAVDCWTCSCRSCTRASQTPSCRSSLAGAHPPRHIGERLGHDDDAPAAHSHTGRRAQSRQGGTSEATLAAMKAAFPHIVLCFIPPHSTSYLQPCDVAVFRSFKSCIQVQASATLARSVIDGSFEGLAMNKAWRRQSSAEWASRAATDLCDENKAWTTGWHRLRAGSNAEFRDAVAEGAALHAHNELFSKHIEPEPAPEDLVDWAMGRGTSVRRRRRRAHARTRRLSRS